MNEFQVGEVRVWKGVVAANVYEYWKILSVDDGGVMYVLSIAVGGDHAVRLQDMSKEWMGEHSRLLSAEELERFNQVVVPGATQLTNSLIGKLELMLAVLKCTKQCNIKFVNVPRSGS